jgi:hypothetical protein
VAFDAAERFFAGLALGLFAGQVGSGLRTPVGLVDGEAVKGAVELAVAASVQAMALGVARGGGDRGAAAGAGELGVGAEALGAGDLADQLGRGERAAAALGEQLRRVALDEGGELCLEFTDAFGVGGDVADELARDPDACGLFGAGEPPGGFAEPFGGVERSVWDLELRPEIVQVPAQPLLIAAPSGDEVLAMVDQQADVQRRAVQMRLGELVDSFLERGTRDGERVIESDLPRSRAERRAPAMCIGATRAIRSPRAIRNRSNAPETCRQSSIAQIRSASSVRAQRSSLPNAPLRAGAVSSPRVAAVRLSIAPQVCVRLCVSVPITIMQLSLRFELMKRTLGGHHSGGSCQAPLRSRRWSSGGARATRHPVGQTSWSTERQ